MPHGRTRTSAAGEEQELEEEEEEVWALGLLSPVTCTGGTSDLHTGCHLGPSKGPAPGRGQRERSESWNDPRENTPL